MAVDANAVETYDNSVLREDLAEQYAMISPEEVPFQEAIGSAEAATQPHHEWSIVDLAAPDGANRVIEGEEAPATDTGTLALRVGNYTQIVDKKAVVTQTSQASDAAAENIQKLAKQVALKIRELKRDNEVMLLQNTPAIIGSSGVARASAGFPAWIKTNTHGETGGTDPTLSGTTQGYPDAGANVGDVPTPVALTETVFNNVIQLIWEAGGNTTMAMVNANNKRVISETFTGVSTQYKDIVDKTLVNSVDIYDSDFGQLSIVPNRFQPTLNADTTAPGNGLGANDNYAVYFIDPDMAGVSWLDPMQQKPLPETGHSKGRLVWAEWTLQVDNEAAHGIIRDTTGAAA